jgi:hypothetical protein
MKLEVTHFAGPPRISLTPAGFVRDTANRKPAMGVSDNWATGLQRSTDTDGDAICEDWKRTRVSMTIYLLASPITFDSPWVNVEELPQ